MTFQHTNRFVPGDTIRAEPMNSIMDRIAADLKAFDDDANTRALRFPAGATGGNVMTVANPNSFVYIDPMGQLTSYPKAAFDSEVTLAVTSAQSASASAQSALISENNARQSEINAAASAELAQEAAGSVAGASFVAGPWNAGTGNFPATPADGSSIWYATTNGAGATENIKIGDLIIYDIVNPGWIHYVGHARVAALEALRASEDSRIETKVDAALAIAAAGL